MALTIRGRPVSFAWLKPPPMPPDGNMTLFEHLRELRYRLVVSAGAIILAMIVCAVFYQWPDGGLFGLLTHPYNVAKASLEVSKPKLAVQMTINNVAGPFSLLLKIVGAAGLVLASPVVLYQIWAFVVPGLLAKEKKWALVFVFSATPLFLAGIVLGYFIMPKGIAVLIGFTPQNFDVENLIETNAFLSFLIKMMIVFGIALLIPVFVLMLNILGVIKGKHLAKFRTFIVFGCFVFGAVATPSTDPFSMLALAIPMMVLFLGCEVVARIIDRRRAQRSDDPDQVDTVLARLQAEDRERRAEAKPARTIVARRPSPSGTTTIAPGTATGDDPPDEDDGGAAVRAPLPDPNGSGGANGSGGVVGHAEEPEADEEPVDGDRDGDGDRPTVRTSSLDVDDFKSAIQALSDSGGSSADVDDSSSAESSTR